MKSDVRSIIYHFAYLSIKKYKTDRNCMKNSIKIGSVLGGFIGVWIGCQIISGLLISSINQSTKKLTAYQEFQHLRDESIEKWISFGIREDYFDPDFIIIIRQINTGKDTHLQLRKYYNYLSIEGQYENLKKDDIHEIVQADYRDDIHVSALIEDKNSEKIEITVKTR